MPAEQFIKTNLSWRQLRHRRCYALVGHCRYPTHGSPNRHHNNQPMSSRRGRYHLVHNGIIEQHRVIAQELALKLTTESDSELLLRLIERVRCPSRALNLAVRHIRGSMAIAVLDARKGVVYLARNDARPLWLSRLRDGRWFFGSTDSILLAALRRGLGRQFMKQIEILVPLAPYHVHMLSPDGLRVVRRGRR